MTSISGPADLALVRRILGEHESAVTSALGGVVADIAGGQLLLTGRELFINRLAGTESFDGDALATVVRMATDVGVPAEVVVSARAGSEVFALLGDSGFQLVSATSVYLTPLPAPQAVPMADVEVVDDANLAAWLDVHADGREERNVVDDYARAAHRLEGATDLVARVGSVPAAVASIIVGGDVAILGGAATLPAFRGRGLQPALLRHRLSMAFDRGCRLAACTAEAGGRSSVNIERAGFRLVDADLHFAAMS